MQTTLFCLYLIVWASFSGSSVCQLRVCCLSEYKSGLMNNLSFNFRNYFSWLFSVRTIMFNFQLLLIIMNHQCSCTDWRIHPFQLESFWREFSPNIFVVLHVWRDKHGDRSTSHEHLDVVSLWNSRHKHRNVLKGKHFFYERLKNRYQTDTDARLITNHQLIQ